MLSRAAALAIALTVAAWSLAPLGPSVECDDHDAAEATPAAGLHGRSAATDADARPQLKDDCCRVRPAAKLPVSTSPKRLAGRLDSLFARTTVAMAASLVWPVARPGALLHPPPRPLQRVLPLLD